MLYGLFFFIDFAFLTDVDTIKEFSDILVLDMAFLYREVEGENFSKAINLQHNKFKLHTKYQNTLLSCINVI